ncbi:DNA repair endonuclease XPF isoform X1 [Diabrotica undecimpunctata]|uniref:DNA repair endonuclease XPF isoform X1 n=2 Tax=Diabrotica undecimpunctata TaxID=50387 RepID=UPI003B635C94
MDEQLNDTEKLLDKADLKYMLEFETQIFLDCLHNDGLIVASKGINLNLVILYLLKVYCDEGNLVLVLKSTEAEEKYYREKLKDPHVYNSTPLTKDREDNYLSGGIHFVTSRVLVVDMLKKRIPIEKITGIIVLKAHSILESCQEAFALRLYRQNNKTGFIKGFTNNVHSFTVGYGHVDRVMRALFVKELYIWPRFHSTIVRSLKARQPIVIELHIPISEKMKRMQTHILDLMNLTVKELKRLNQTIELQEITVENCLTKKFHKILQAQLDVIWHQLSKNSLQLVADLKTLRHLMITMFHSDPVSYYSSVMGYRSKEYAQQATWVLLEPAELLFSQVSSFIFNEKKEFHPDLCPKWKPLLEILQVEIPAEMKERNLKDSTILILSSDYRSCHQLKELLTKGPHLYLFLRSCGSKLPIKKISDAFRVNDKIPAEVVIPEEKPDKKNLKNKKLKLDSKSTSSESDPKDNTEDDKDQEDIEDFQNSYILTMSQTICENKHETTSSSRDESTFVFEPFSQMENMDLTQICETVHEPKILIQTFKGSNEFTNLQNTLESVKPQFIVMYHCSMTAVREIEMYESHKTDEEPVKVYFLLHADTVEEQSYLTTLRREKEAFEYLIEAKSKMVIPADQDGKSDDNITLQRGIISPEKNTREGGKEQTPKKQVVIVDMREFRSELPTLIHKRGMDIEPLTISIGDYVLTPEICVERKSISDLIGSLNSGRLYQQCTNMSRFYSKPMLLIEFDQNKQFGWRSNYMISSDSNNFDIQQKLLLLTLHFPKLKIIWSPSPYATAQLFEELKLDKEDPNIAYAAALGGEQDLDTIQSKYNSNIYDFVQKLPGITSKNIDAFLRKGISMDEVTKKSEEELKEILGSSADAQSLYSIIHGEHKPKPEEDKKKERPKTRFKSFKKKQA